MALGEALANVFHEALAGEVDSALDCTDGQFHHFGDFLVLVALVVEEEWLAVNEVEVFEYVEQLLHHDIGHGFVFTGVPVIDEDEAVRGFADSGAVALLAVEIDEGVSHDGSDPCPEVGTDLEFLTVVEGTKRCFLDEVPRIFEVVGQAVGERQQLRLKVIEIAIEFDRTHGWWF